MTKLGSITHMRYLGLFLEFCGQQGGGDGGAGAGLAT